MNFRIGQKIVCVDDTHRIYRNKHPLLTKGVIYTVAGFGPTYCGSIGIYLDEVRNSPTLIYPLGQAFYCERFRPAVEQKTDISSLVALLNPVNHKQLEGV